jgi:hypothetical protein
MWHQLQWYTQQRKARYTTHPSSNALLCHPLNPERTLDRRLSLGQTAVHALAIAPAYMRRQSYGACLLCRGHECHR